LLTIAGCIFICRKAAIHSQFLLLVALLLLIQCTWMTITSLNFVTWFQRNQSVSRSVISGCFPVIYRLLTRSWRADKLFFVLNVGVLRATLARAFIWASTN
jgi:hypothetical protein